MSPLSEMVTAACVAALAGIGASRLSDVAVAAGDVFFLARPVPTATLESGGASAAERTEETEWVAPTLGLALLSLLLVLVASQNRIRELGRSNAALAAELGARESASSGHDGPRVASAGAASPSSADDGFLSMMSHELRTPLAAIRVQAQLASAQSAAGSRAAFEAIIRDADRAWHLLECFLDLARINAFAGRLDGIDAVSLRKILDIVLDDLDQAVLLKNITTSVDLEVDALVAHRLCIELAIRNLLSNSIQYCTPGGNVGISARLAGDGVDLTIDDSGPGIPETLRQRALEPFERLGRFGGDGVGLGLAIVAQVARLHRATLELSQSPQGGLRVVLHFPQPGRGARPLS